MICPEQPRSAPPTPLHGMTGADMVQYRSKCMGLQSSQARTPVLLFIVVRYTDLEMNPHGPPMISHTMLMMKA